MIHIGGPTASGKTSLAIELAKHYECEVISADSRQFYREISIGTAKPKESELQDIKHHFIDTLSIHDEYSAGHFERDSIALITELHQSSDYVIVVGGTGLYHRAIYEGLDHYPSVDRSIVHRYTEQLKNNGIASLQEELKEKDPTYASKVDLNNGHRLIRALSIIESSGATFSSFQTGGTAKRNFTSIMLAVERDREQLYERINMRVEQMMQEGLLEEAKRVFNDRHLNSLNTVGYKELFSYLDGTYSLDTAIDKIKQHTRNYAKRQITWYRNQDNWSKITEIEDAIQKIDDKIDKNR